MHRRRQTTLGIARSGGELFCSVSSTTPRSPSPSKQDLYELLQQRHRMHSFTKRFKNYMSEKDSGPEVEIPSYMRQTCSSMIKRSNSKTRSKDYSSSGGKRGSWDDEKVFAGRRFKSVRKAMTVGGGSSSFALTLDGHPQSTASKLDSLATLSTDFAYTSSNCDEVYEFEDNKLANEHTMLEKDTTDEALFMTPAVVHELFDNQVPKKGSRTRDSSALLSDGSLCSVNVEFGTSSNTIRFHEASRGSFEDDVFLTNSHVEQLDFQSNEHARSDFVKSPNHRQPSAQSTVREDIHTEVLLSSGPDEQDFLCGNRSQELQEITRPDDIGPSIKSTSSSLHQHNMFCNTDESHEPFLRSTFTQDFQNSNSLLQLSTSDLQLAASNQFYDDRSESGLLLYSSTRQGSFRRQSLSERSSQDEDLEAMAEQQAALSDPTDVWGPVSNREDTKPAEDGCLEQNNSLTEENSEFYVTSDRLLGSVSSLASSNEYPAPNGQFSSELMESEELRSEQQKTEDTPNPKATSSSLQNQSSLPNTVQKAQIRGLEDPRQMETVEEVVRVNPLGPIRTPVYNNTFENSSMVYDKHRGTTTNNTSLSHSEDKISESESLFLVQCSKPRSLSEPFTMQQQQRRPSADYIALFTKSPRSEAQFRDDHSATLLSSFPADLYSGQELSVVLDPVLDQSSPRFSEVKEGSDGQQDQLFVAPCDQLKDLAKFERQIKRGERINNSADYSGSMRRGWFKDQSSTNQQSIGEIDSAEHCRSDIGSAKAVSDDQTIEQNLDFSGRSSHTFGSFRVRSSVSVRSEKGLKNRFQKFVETVKESYKEKKQQQETKKKFPHCFQSKMKACFGCSKASPVLHETDSMAQNRESQRRASKKNNSTMFN